MQRCKPSVEQDSAHTITIAETINTSRGHGDMPKNIVAEYFRFLILVLCFSTLATCLHIQQWLGTPLYLMNHVWAEAWQGFVKESTALLVLALNQWRAPVTTHVSCDASVKGQIRMTPKGKIIFDFPPRLVLIANHQLYTDWIFLWWSAYSIGYHGRFFIVLKDAIRNIPILGYGMVFFSWIFLSRRWEADKASLEESISRLSEPHNPINRKRNPMWLLIFPEGTNLSKRSLALSRKWADKNSLPHSDLTLLPRTRGLRTCLDGLGDSVDWLYDCTLAYDQIPRGQDGQDIYNLKTLYIEGRRAPATHAYWRRFAVSEIPSHDTQAFDRWLYERWAEKAKLLEYFQIHKHFPTTGENFRGSIELQNALEIVQVFTCILAPLTVFLTLRYICG